jgi:hypothetical protein
MDTRFLESDRTVRQVNTYGYFVAKEVSHSIEGKIFLPTEIASPDGKARIDLNKAKPEVALSCKEGSDLLYISGNGFFFKSNRKKQSLKAMAGKKRLAQLIIRDQELRDSLLSLNKVITIGLPVFVGQTRIKVPQKLVSSLRESNNKFMAELGKKPAAAPAQKLPPPAGSPPSSALPAPLLSLPAPTFWQPMVICTWERVVEYIVEPILILEDVILTAGVQLENCLANCWNTFIEGREWPDWFNYTACSLVCTGTAFSDIVIGCIETWDYVTREVVTYVLQCAPQLVPPVPVIDEGGISDPGAASRSDIIKAKEILKPLMNVLSCIVKGEWGLDQLRDLRRLDTSGFPTIPTTQVEQVPIAVRVCVGHECAITIRDSLFSLGLDALGTSLVILIANGSVGAAILELFGAAIITAIAASLSLTVPELLLIIAAILLYFAIHAVIISTQIYFFERGKGVCFHKSPIPIPIAPGMLLDSPVIVTAR